MLTFNMRGLWLYVGNCAPRAFCRLPCASGFPRIEGSIFQRCADRAMPPATPSALWLSSMWDLNCAVIFLCLSCVVSLPRMEKLWRHSEHRHATGFPSIFSTTINSGMSAASHNRHAINCAIVHSIGVPYLRFLLCEFLIPAFLPCLSRTNAHRGLQSPFQAPRFLRDTKRR
jgi:hypothetical protein